jgi:hypothetical protein
MIHFRQHVPNFISDVEPFEFSAKDTAELLAHSWTKNWSMKKDFERFSVSDKKFLMAEFKPFIDGDPCFWVLLGYLSGDIPELPEWEEKPLRSE